MSIIAKILIALIALEHVYFLVLEMFLWTKPRTRAAFGMSAEQAEQSKVLAANQGLYNGFLAAGLIWSLLAPASYASSSRYFSSAACWSPAFTAARPRTGASGTCRRCPPRSRLWCCLSSPKTAPPAKMRG